MAVIRNRKRTAPRKRVLKTPDMELALMGFLDVRRKLIVPNISWGMFNHELDLGILLPSGYVHEVEIKVSLGDLRADKKKKHQHLDLRIRCLWFALPEWLEPHLHHVPDEAGIILVSEWGRCRVFREPKPRKNARKLSAKERFQFARLGAIRIYSMKRKMKEINECRDILRNRIKNMRKSM